MNKWMAWRKLYHEISRKKQKKIYDFIPGDSTLVLVQIILMGIILAPLQANNCLVVQDRPTPPPPPF